MVQKTLAELVEDLEQRHRLGEPPPILLLGAGASVESGVGAMTDLFKLVRRDSFEQFCEYVRPLTPGERYRLLARFLSQQHPEDITSGYRALATLCEAAYLDVVLTTNVDPLLDDALVGARLWRRDYILLVNGVVRPDRIEVLLAATTPRVKVLKLHGDLFCRFMAWTPAEMEDWVGDIWATVAHAIRGRDVLVVGHSLRDDKVRDLVLGTDGAVWYLTPFTTPDALVPCDRVRAVVGPEAAFEQLFVGLVRALGLVPSAPAMVSALSRAGTHVSVADSARRVDARAFTVDDLMSATVGIASPDGARMLSGFVLAEPHVIVTDGRAACPEAERLIVITGEGDRVEARVRHRFAEHAFGPLVLEAPASLSTMGLALDREPCSAGLSVRMSVASGARPGLSEGQVVSGSEEDLNVDLLGPVPNLVRIQGRVAPWASGAPVVDDSMTVRGFVVAGGETGPPCFMYPATAWAAPLQARMRLRSS